MKLRSDARGGGAASRCEKKPESRGNLGGGCQGKRGVRKREKQRNNVFSKKRERRRILEDVLKKKHKSEESKGFSPDLRTPRQIRTAEALAEKAC